MIKELVRKQVFILIGIVSCLAIIFGLVLSFAGINNYFDVYVNQNAYINATYNYIIPSPSKAQVPTLNELSFVESVSPYYTSIIEIKSGQKVISSSVYFVDDVSILECSPFSEDRQIDSISSSNKNCVYIDYLYSQRNNIGLGDCVLIKNIEYEVTKIFEPNSFVSNGCVVVCWDLELKNALNATSINYSGAWLKANNNEECENYLKNTYVPEGRIRNQGLQETDQQYQSYLDNFYKNNFYNEVTKIGSNFIIAKTKLDLAKNTIIIEEIVIGLLLFVTIFFGIIYIYFSNDRRVKLQKAIQANSENQKILVKNVTLLSWLIPLVSNVLVVITGVLLAVLMGWYVNLSLIIISLIIICSSMILTSGVLILVNNILLNKKYKILKSQER